MTDKTPAILAVAFVLLMSFCALLAMGFSAIWEAAWFVTEQLKRLMHRLSRKKREFARAEWLLRAAKWNHDRGNAHVGMMCLLQMTDEVKA